MPIGALSRIPTSVSRNGTCKSNLRGASPSAPYDYAAPSRTFTVGAALGSISTAGAGDWSNTITRAYDNTDAEGDATILYSPLLSNAKNGTLLFRMNINPLPTPPGLQFIFTNGLSNGYGIYLTYDEVAVETFEYNLHFGRQQDASDSWVKLNSSPLSDSTWYQYSIRFTTPLPKTFVDAYQNGTQTVTTAQLDAMTTPTNKTTLMGFFGRLTDFAFLEAELSDSELAAFGTAPYI